MSEHATTPAASIPNPSSSNPSSSASPLSPPLDPSKLNHAPAPLPSAAPSNADPTAPLRSPESGPHDSSYLDNGLSESPSHPTIAETGTISPNEKPDAGPGPISGQLKRVEGGAKGEKEIIKLGSLGGEGLVRKPPVGNSAGEGDQA